MRERRPLPVSQNRSSSHSCQGQLQIKMKQYPLNQTAKGHEIRRIFEHQLEDVTPSSPSLITDGQVLYLIEFD